jgi:hypothetical protein
MNKITARSAAKEEWVQRERESAKVKEKEM